MIFKLIVNYHWAMTLLPDPIESFLILMRREAPKKFVLKTFRDIITRKVELIKIAILFRDFNALYKKLLDKRFFFIIFSLNFYVFREEENKFSKDITINSPSLGKSNFEFKRSKSGYIIFSPEDLYIHVFAPLSQDKVNY